MSEVILENNTITNHPEGYGVIVTRGSVSRLVGNAFDGNGTGIDFGATIAGYRNAVLRLNGSNTIVNTGWAGIDVEMNSFARIQGSGNTITATGIDAFNRTRLAVSAFNGGYVDIRAGATITGNIGVTALSSFRSRTNTITGNINVFANSVLGIRNDVTLTGSVTCGGSTVEFSNNGTAKCGGIFP